MNILHKGWSRERDISKKVDDFSKSKHKSCFLIKLKAIKNTMGFSHLFIFQLRS